MVGKEAEREEHSSDGRNTAAVVVVVRSPAGHSLDGNLRMKGERAHGSEAAREHAPAATAAASGNYRLTRRMREFAASIPSKDTGTDWAGTQDGPRYTLAHTRLRDPLWRGSRRLEKARPAHMNAHMADDQPAREAAAADRNCSWT